MLFIEVRIIKSHLSSLEWLEGLIVDLIDAANSGTDQAYLLVAAKNLSKQFITEILRLRMAIDMLLDPSAFVLVSI